MQHARRVPEPESVAPKLIDALTHYAEVETDQVHPLHLGLGADVVLMARRRGLALTAEAFAESPDHANKGRKLVERLLKYCPTEVEHAVHALAAARGFDAGIFHALGERMHFHYTSAAFAILTGFSFVWQAPRPESATAPAAVDTDAGPHPGWYRIHELLRRILTELAPERMQQAHAALEAIYRGHAETDPVAIAEAIYHANRQDWKRGVSGDMKN